MIDNEAKNSLKYYFDNDKQVHIMQTNKIFFNGKIVLLKSDHCIIEERELGCKVVYYKNIYDISEFVEKK